MRHYLFLAAAILLSTSFASSQHAGDIFVGRTAGGQLRATGFADEEFYVPLMPVSGLLNGWADNDPGFDRVLSSDPASDLYTLQPGAQIWLRLIEIAPSFRVIDSSFAILDDAGEQTFLGGSNLHTHLTWHINSSHPAFDPAQCVWEATFILRDFGSTGYAPSEPFTFAFTNVERVEATGDWEEDGDVDSGDFAAWPDCFAGPSVRPAPEEVTTCEVDCLNAFDLEDDDDVDLADFARFQVAFAPS